MTRRAGASSKSSRLTMLPSVSGNEKSGAGVPSGVIVETVSTMGLPLELLVRVSCHVVVHESNAKRGPRPAGGSGDVRRFDRCGPRLSHVLRRVESWARSRNRAAAARPGGERAAGALLQGSRFGRDRQTET